MLCTDMPMPLPVAIHDKLRPTPAGCDDYRRGGAGHSCSHRNIRTARSTACGWAAVEDQRSQIVTSCASLLLVVGSSPVALGLENMPPLSGHQYTTLSSAKKST